MLSSVSAWLVIIILILLSLLPELLLVVLRKPRGPHSRQVYFSHTFLLLSDFLNSSFRPYPSYYPLFFLIYLLFCFSVILHRVLTRHDVMQSWPIRCLIHSYVDQDFRSSVERQNALLLGLVMAGY